LSRTIVSRILLLLICCPLFAQDQQINESQVKNLVADLAAKGTITAIQQQSYVYAADTGSANAYAVTLSPAPTITAGSIVVVKIANANSGASTLAVNGGTATAIKKQGSTALASGDLSAGQIGVFVNDGTNFQLIGGSGGSGSTTNIPVVATTGSVNAMVATFSPAITAYTFGLFIEVLPNLTNTSSTTTINVNGLGAKAIGKGFGLGGTSAVAIGDLSASQPAILYYNGTNFVLLNPQVQVLSSAGSATTPAFSFASATGYGMWVASGAVRLSANTLDILDCNTGGCTVNGLMTSNYFNPSVTTVGLLGSAAGHGAGTQKVVSDASNALGATCVGGGTTYMIALSNGTTWTCH
jgi:hypothetical protein